MTTAKLLCIHRGLVDAIVSLDSNFGLDKAVFKKLIKADGIDPNNSTIWDVMKHTVQEEFLP